MAAKLQCEICGGKLIGKPGGIFECENCGTEYSTEWAKAKIQEITGTVKVEGTVEVTGKVQVDSSANKEALLQRGTLALEDGKWEEAKGFFNRALDLDAQCAEAYLGLAMAEERCSDRVSLEKKYISPNAACRNSKFIARARQFEPELEAWFTKLDKQGCSADENTRIEQKRKEENARQKKHAVMTRLASIRQRNALAAGVLSDEYSHMAGLRADGTVLAMGANYNGRCDVSGWHDIVAIATGSYHTVGLRSDGTVVATKYTGDQKDYRGQCDVSSWRGIVAIAAGEYHTLGLRSDGTVVAAGKNDFGQCEVADWTDIVAVSTAFFHTVGLRSDGTVVATKYTGDQKNYRGQCDVSGWQDIVAIVAGWAHTVGLRSDGTVVAAGRKYSSECKVSRWTDIVDISVQENRTIGLRSDGTVVATGLSIYGECNVSDWRDIVAIATGSHHTVGLKADGSVIATKYFGDYYSGQCEVGSWRDIVAISAESDHTVGLRSDGRVFAVGTDYDQSRVSDWKLFESIDTIEAERKAAVERAEAERKAAEEKAEAERRAKVGALNKEKAQLQAELPSIKGLFSGGKRKQIEIRLAEIEAELKRLG